MQGNQPNTEHLDTFIYQRCCIHLQPPMQRCNVMQPEQLLSLD